MTEAFLLLVELGLFGLVLLAVGRKRPQASTRDLGIFSYRETLDAPPGPPPAPAKAKHSA